MRLRKAYYRLDFEDTSELFLQKEERSERSQKNNDDETIIFFVPAIDD